MMTFTVVKSSSPNNAILGKPRLNELKAFPSYVHLAMKFPTPNGVATIRADQRVARQCYVLSLERKREEMLQIAGLKPPMEALDQSKPSTDEEVELIELDLELPEREAKIGSLLPNEVKKDLTGLLQEYRDVFVWSAEDMPGIPRHIIEHKLNVDPKA